MGTARRHVGRLAGLGLVFTCAAARAQTPAVEASISQPTRVSSPAAPRRPAVPVSPRVLISDLEAADIVRRGLIAASRALADDRCQTLLTEFRDRRGRPLAERLATLNVDLRTYLSSVVFTDWSGHVVCDRGILAATQPGSRVVHVCGGSSLERSWHVNPDHVVASYIHEILHTLGLGENPPPSADITARVLALCPYPAYDRGTREIGRGQR